MHIVCHGYRWSGRYQKEGDVWLLLFYVFFSVFKENIKLKETIKLKKVKERKYGREKIKIMF